MHELKKYLFGCYGGFSDKRIKDLNKSEIFIVDDRSESDIDARGNLYSYFCMIFASVKSDQLVEVDLLGNVPMNKRVKNWIERMDAEYTEGIQPSLKFTVGPGKENILNDLADRIESIVRSGAPRYSVPSYKYVCPRTAQSLRRLAEILRKYWRKYWRP
jgi:hypothetical protein